MHAGTLSGAPPRALSPAAPRQQAQRTDRRPPARSHLHGREALLAVALLNPYVDIVHAGARAVVLVLRSVSKSICAHAVVVEGERARSGLACAWSVARRRLVAHPRARARARLRLPRACTQGGRATAPGTRPPHSPNPPAGSVTTSVMKRSERGGSRSRRRGCKRGGAERARGSLAVGGCYGGVEAGELRECFAGRVRERAWGFVERAQPPAPKNTDKFFALSRPTLSPERRAAPATTRQEEVAEC